MRRTKDFDSCSQDVVLVPIWIIVGFQRRDRQNPAMDNNDTSSGPLKNVLNT